MISIVDTSQMYAGQGQTALPSGSFVPLTPDTMQWAQRTVEKIRAAVAGGLRFLPRLDNYSKETAEIRAAYRLMLKEPVLKTAHKKKVASVAQLDWQVIPASDSKRDQRIAEFWRYALRKVRGGTVQVTRNILRGAIMDGFSVCDKVKSEPLVRGPWKGKIIYEAIKSKDTENLTLSTDEFRNITAVRPTAFGIGEEYTPDGFIIYSYDALFESALGTSDHRSPYGAFFRKDTIVKLWNLHLDKYVSPLMKGTYTTFDQKAALEEAMEQARSNTWLTVPQGAMIEAVALASRGEAEFQAACEYADRQMLIGTSGAYLQTLEGGTPDGRGNTKVHEDAEGLFNWELSADVQAIVNEQMVPDLTEINFAGADPPQIVLGAVSEEEMLTYLKIDKGLQELGFRHDRDKIAKRYSREEATDPDKVLIPAGKPAMEAQPQPLGGPGAAAPPPLGLPGGGLDQTGGPADALPFSESFFTDCERDEGGHCLPGGASADDQPAPPHLALRDMADRLSRYCQRADLDAEKVVGQTKAAYLRLMGERAANPLLYSPASPEEVFESVAGQVISTEQERNRLAQRQAEADKFNQLKGDFLARDVPALPELGESQAAVKVVSKRSVEQVQKMVDATMGRDFPLNKFASLVGAPANAIVTITPSREANRFTIRVKHPDYAAKRTIGRDYMGRLHIHNDEFFIRDGSQGKGLGKQVFTAQVEAAAREGFEYIETFGAGNGNFFSSMNGYYTWPRFGYDQKIDYLGGVSDALKGAIKDRFPGAETISDVMLTPEGRAWWKANGSGITNLRFDLAAKSRSMKILSEYLSEKPLRDAVVKHGETDWQDEEIDDIGNGYENPDKEKGSAVAVHAESDFFFATCDRDEHGYCIGEGGQPRSHAAQTTADAARLSAVMSQHPVAKIAAEHAAAILQTVTRPGTRREKLTKVKVQAHEMRDALAVQTVGMSTATEEKAAQRFADLIADGVYSKARDAIQYRSDNPQIAITPALLHDAFTDSLARIREAKTPAGLDALEAKYLGAALTPALREATFPLTWDVRLHGVPPASKVMYAPLGSTVQFAESYFATCDRDEHGQCLPGSGGEKTSAEKTSGAKPTSAKTPPAAYPFPSPAALTAGVRKELKPGVNKVTVGNTPYAVKNRSDSVTGGKREAHVHAMGRLARVNAPAVALTTFDGRPASVQQWIEGQTVKDMPAADKVAAIQKAREQAERQVLFDYLIGHGDGHEGNFVVRSDGKLVGIDRELTFESGARDEAFRPERRGLLPLLAGSQDAVNDYAFDPKTATDMASAGRDIVDYLKGQGLSRDAARVLNRVEVLEGFAKGSGKTVADLVKASQSPPFSFAKLRRNIFGA